MASPSTEPNVGRRERKKQAQNRALFETAIRLFARDGYAATTVAEIADAADVSVSTFFAHFPTKEAVAFAGSEPWWGELADRIASRPREATAVDVFAAFVRSRLLWTHDSEVETLRLKVIAASDELQEAARRRLTQTLEPILRDAYARDLGRARDELVPQLLAASTVAAFATFARVRNLGLLDSTLTIDDVLERFDELVALLDGALRPFLGP